MSIKLLATIVLSDKILIFHRKQSSRFWILEAQNNMPNGMHDRTRKVYYVFAVFEIMQKSEYRDKYISNNNLVHLLFRKLACTGF